MKLKQVLEIQKVLGKTIPIDMNHKWVYYSDSREEWVDIMDLDIVHDVPDYWDKLKSIEEIT
jgi:hypothetical protein